MNQFVKLPNFLYWHLCAVDIEDFVCSRFQEFNTEFWLHDNVNVESASRINGEHCYVTIIDCNADNCNHDGCKRFIVKIAKENLAVHCNSCGAKLAYDDICYTKNGKVNYSKFTMDMVFNGEMPVCKDCED